MLKSEFAFKSLFIMYTPSFLVWLKSKIATSSFQIPKAVLAVAV